MKKDMSSRYKTWLYVLGSFVGGVILALLIVQYFKEPIIRLIVSQ